MRRKPKKRSAKKTIALLGGAAALLIILIVAVRFYRSEPLIGPESPEMRAKRESPDNAYYALVDLAKTIPAVPSPIGRSRFVSAQRVQGVQVIASRLGILRPDDDPEVLAYLADTRPLAVAAARVLEEQEYYCTPIMSLAENTVRIASLQALSQVLCGHALYAAKTEKPDEAFMFALASFRLGKAVANDGPFVNVVMGCEIIRDGAITALCLPWETYSEQQLREFLDALGQIAPTDLNFAKTIDWELRLIEAGVYSSTEEKDGGGLMSNLREAALRRFIRKHEAELREIEDMSYEKSQLWARERRRTRRIEARALGTRFTKYAVESIEAMTLAGTYAEGLRAVIALELYRKSHGVHPETLDALVSGFLDSIPQDFFASQPLRYKLKDDSYTLYSVGPSGEDNGGDEKRDILIPPLVAGTFKTSLQTPDE